MKLLLVLTAFVIIGGPVATCHGIDIDESPAVFYFDAKRADELHDWITYIYAPKNKLVIASLRPRWSNKINDIEFVSPEFSAKVETNAGDLVDLPLAESEITNAPGRYTLLYGSPASVNPRLAVSMEAVRMRLREYVRKHPGYLPTGRAVKLVIGFRAYRFVSGNSFAHDVTVEADYLLIQLKETGACEVIGYCDASLTGSKDSVVMFKN